MSLYLTDVQARLVARQTAQQAKWLNQFHSDLYAHLSHKAYK